MGTVLKAAGVGRSGHQIEAPWKLLMPLLVHFSCCQSYGTDTATDGRFDTFTRFSPEALRNSVQGLAQTGFGVSMFVSGGLARRLAAFRGLESFCRPPDMRNRSAWLDRSVAPPPPQCAH